MKGTLKLAEDNQVSVGRKPHIRCKFALPAISCQLPPDCHRIVVAPLGVGAAAFFIVVAMNK
jgi:hypothetical protein